MAIELIAIDMDGTLLNPQHEVTPAVKKALSEARAKGVQIVLATGRPFVGVQRYLMELDLQRTVVTASPITVRWYIMRKMAALLPK